MVTDALIQKNKSSVASVTLFLFLGGEFAEGADARRASRRRRLRRGAPASAEPKRPAGVFGLRCGVAEGQREVPHTGKMKQG